MTNDEIQAMAEDIIENVSPNDFERITIGNEHIFELARHLKGLFADVELAKDYVHRWHSRWKNELLDDCQDFIDLPLCWSMFIDAWDKVDSPKVHMGSIIQRAVSRQEPPPKMDWCKDEKRILLAKVCYELQLQVGLDKPFSLSGYQASEILIGTRKKQKQGARVMDMFCNAGVLKCVDRGKKGKDGISAKYLYIARHKCLIRVKS